VLSHIPRHSLARGIQAADENRIPNGRSPVRIIGRQEENPQKAKTAQPASFPPAPGTRSPASASDSSTTAVPESISAGPSPRGCKSESSITTGLATTIKEAKDRSNRRETGAGPPCAAMIRKPTVR